MAAATESVEAALDPDAADPSADLGGGAATVRLRLVCDGAAACADAADADEVPGILLALAVEALEPDRATVSLLAAGGARDGRRGLAGRRFRTRRPRRSRVASWRRARRS